MRVSRGDGCFLFICLYLVLISPAIVVAIKALIAWLAG